MRAGTTFNKFTTAPACRAKAASFRTMAQLVTHPELKAKMLRDAEEWEAKAAAFEARLRGEDGN
jgi:hypothetical protein